MPVDYQDLQDYKEAIKDWEWRLRSRRESLVEDPDPSIWSHQEDRFWEACDKLETDIRKFFAGRFLSRERDIDPTKDFTRDGIPVRALRDYRAKPGWFGFPKEQTRLRSAYADVNQPTLAHWLAKVNEVRQLGEERFAPGRRRGKQWEREELKQEERLAKLKYEHEQSLKDKDIELRKLELELEKLRDERAERERDKQRAHELQAEQVKAELERMRLGVTQPAELQKQLATLILAAWEKQERDPTFAATFGNLQAIMGQASTTITHLVQDTDAEGKKLTKDARELAEKEALTLVMQIANRLVDRKLT